MKIRLPLQVGTTAFWSLTRCAALLLPATALFLVAVPIVGVVSIVAAWEALKAGLIKTAGVILIVGAVILGVLLLLVISAVKHLMLALRERPSDVVFDDDELVIVGGRHHGRVFRLDAIECRLEVVGKTRTRFIGADTKLKVAQLKLDGVIVAEAVRPVEHESLRALADTIATRRRKDRAGEPAETKAQVLRCPACDAAAVPDDAEEVTCAYCKGKVPVKQDLRERLRAQRSLEQHRPGNERMLHRLLEQPSARTIGAVMAGLGLPILLVWPAASVIVYLQWKRGVLGFVNCTALGLAAATAIAALFFLLRATLVNRMALSLVSTRFGAVAPRKPGEPHLCRACLAPLPAPANQLLVHCAYCDSENVLGLDLRSEARSEAKQHRSLDAELGRRRRERWVWALAALGAAGVLVADRWILAYTFRPHTDAARCRTGDVAACLREGKRHEAKAKDAGGEANAALASYQRACRRDDKEGCLAAARLAYTHHDWYGLGEVSQVLGKACDLGDGHACYTLGGEETDLARTAARYDQGCRLGDAVSCSDLGFAYSKGKGVAVDKARALELYLLGCEKGSGLGCRNAGWVTEHAAPPDLARAAGLYDQGCARDAEQCSYAGDFWARRCAGGDDDGCTLALEAYAKRTNRPDDDEYMFDQFVCDRKGKPLALGCWRAGQVADARKDWWGARAYWQKACDGDVGDACSDLGVKWVRGQGGGKDRDRAVKLYDKACKLGSKLGCQNLANLRGGE